MNCPRKNRLDRQCHGKNRLDMDGLDKNCPEINYSKKNGL